MWGKARGLQSHQRIFIIAHKSPVLVALDSISLVWWTQLFVRFFGDKRDVHEEQD